MSRLLKILLFAFGFLALTASPSFAAGSCLAPRPENPAVDLLIKEAQQRNGAAAAVDAKVLKAIYVIEGMDPGYTNPDEYTCKKNTAGALGLMQIKDDMYQAVVPSDAQMSDEGVCQETNCKLSRCNPVDAIEIAARVLLKKIYLWDDNIDKPLGKLSSKDDAYYSSCRYYGSFDYDDTTNNLSDWLSSSQIPPDGTLTYCEFVCAYSGKCTSYGDYPARTDKPYSGTKSSVKFTFDACGQPQPSPIPVNFTVHPLRPYPYTLVQEETDKKISDSTLTPYCAMRPTAVQFNVHDKRDPTTKIYTIGTLTSNFQSFITPLLSITDPKKPDYSLSYPDKAQRYLADFLEGRAFYEPFTEPVNPTLDQQTDLFTRLGVFRKLAPKTYQDKLKRALILRAAGQFDSSADNPYGFLPATEQVQNYTVGYWDGANAWSPNDQHGQKITLQDFVNNWAPIPEDYKDSDAYALASAAWQIEANSKWFKLWSYVPMFTREDTKGFIQVLDDTGPPGPQTSDKKEVAVIHPHLARTYEVATSLSYLLSPASTHDAPTPELEEKWYSPAPWDTETPWWMKSYTAGGELGQSVCDFKPEVSLISSSGDLAKDDLITTSVNRVEILAPNPFYEGPPSYDSKCGVDLYPCQKCKNIPGFGPEIDDSDCRVVKDARYDPTYFFTYTPFLNQILTSLTESPRGIFDFFKTASASADKTVDWPGVGNPGEESPVYDFKSSSGQKSLAEAGFHKPGSNQGFLYRYLGTIQCAKEKVLAVLQPFITGESYEPYATDCFRQPGEPGPGAFGIPAVGCTDEKSPIGFDNTASSPIAQRAWEIVSDLYQGFWCYWNRSPGDFATDVTDYPPGYPELFDEALYAQIPNPTSEQINKQYFNMFWCTWLVTKAFNETGLSMPTNLLYTPDMVQWFKDQGKYTEAAGATYQDVVPGDAIFFQIPPDYGRINHTAIVYSVNEDGITTVESNAGYKTMFYPTDTNGNIQTIVGEIKIEGFGKP